jgi:HEAT repeat protein
MKTDTNLEKLIDDIAHGSELDAIEAAKALIKVQPSIYAMQLSEILKTAANPHNKQAAAYALTWLEKNKDALDALICALIAVDLPESVRGQAAEGIGEHKPRKNHKLRQKAEAAILAALKDNSPEVRFWACFAAGKIKLKEALPILHQIKEEDKSVNPGWWYVSEEAEDAIEWIHGRAGKDRIPVESR